MRVAIVDPASWSLAYDLPLAEALARAGCEVTLHCATSPHVGLPTTDIESLTIEESFYAGRLPLPRRLARMVQHPIDMWLLARRLRDDADIVHVQWMPGRSFDARVWARLVRTSNVKVTFTAHNAQERGSRLDTDELAAFTAVIAHSDGGALALRRRGLKHVWRLMIGAYDQYATSADPDELPVDLPADAPVALFAGLLRTYKGVDVLLDAWPQVVERVPNAQLVIAGRPVDVELPDTPPAGVTLLPRFTTEEELGWLLRRADVVALPYLEIDMSGIAVSALACGTPLVASDIGGLGEYVGRGALTVPPNDPTALAAALADVLGDRELQQRLSAEAVVAVREHYAWSTIAEYYRDHYADLGLRW
ncbi:MAG: glycosyltransferase family 4 protein [Thermoleophilia bacterium]|nr:glycosyltransferase family 4 protein [Thermoleophilia bacterium]